MCRRLRAGRIAESGDDISERQKAAVDGNAFLNTFSSRSGTLELKMGICNQTVR